MTLGRRLPDTDVNHLAEGWGPGDYWRVLTEDGSRPMTPEEYGGKNKDYPSNLTGGVWWVVTPNGVPAVLCLHTVREHEDGTISIRPGDGSSNSVLVEGYSHELKERVSWHGYVEHGVWTPC
jgi:hypothetical protein